VTVKTMTLTDFLLARIEEDVVKRVTMREWHAADCDAIPEIGSEYTYPCDCGVPERMARECEAKRRIVAEHPHLMFMVTDPKPAACDRCQVRGWCPTIRLLALPYADHPDYDEEWRP
jgi:hypothetical protein